MNTQQQVKVGLLYNPSLSQFLKDNPGSCDYIEIIPDMFWTDSGHGQKNRFEPIPSWKKQLDRMASEYPIVAHNIGFSLGTAGHFDTGYLENLQKWHQEYGFQWHSDHLSYVKLEDEHNFDHNTGMAIPLAFDWEVLDIISKKIRMITDAIDAPFLVENNVYFIDIPEQEMTEAEFLNNLARQAGCGLLLDLHNVYANSRNHALDSQAFITALDLHEVQEIHIAGGNEMGDMYADSHAGPCPDEVWELLHFTIPRCKHLQAITFEFHDSYFHLLKYEGILSELSKARNCWMKNLVH
jgi:uncharacterized protein (UPF0276 family)